MGLVGVICDDDEQKYDFEACITCSLKGFPRSCHAPTSLIVAMSKNQEERKDAGLSATALLDCARKVILSQEEEFYEKPSAYHARFRGTLTHLLIEEYGSGLEGVVQEQRVRKSLDVDGLQVEITGKPDWIDVNRKLIVDYKSCVSLNRKPINAGKPKDGHESQVNIYRWLVAGGINMVTNEVVDYDIELGGILYISMEGSRKVPVRIWSLDETEEFLRDRLRPHLEYKQTKRLPPILSNEKGERSYLCNYCALREACDAREELRNLE